MNNDAMNDPNPGQRDPFEARKHILGLLIPGDTTELLLHREGRALWHRRRHDWGRDQDWEESNMPLTVVQESAACLASLASVADALRQRLSEESELLQGRQHVSSATANDTHNRDGVLTQGDRTVAGPREPTKVLNGDMAAAVIPGDTVELVLVRPRNSQHAEGRAYWRDRRDPAVEHEIDLPQDVADEAALSVLRLIDAVTWIRARLAED